MTECVPNIPSQQLAPLASCSCRGISAGPALPLPASRSRLFARPRCGLPQPWLTCNANLQCGSQSHRRQPADAVSPLAPYAGGYPAAVPLVGGAMAGAAAGKPEQLVGGPAQLLCLCLIRMRYEHFTLQAVARQSSSCHGVLALWRRLHDGACGPPRRLPGQDEAQEDEGTLGWGCKLQLAGGKQGLLHLLQVLATGLLAGCFCSLPRLSHSLHSSPPPPLRSTRAWAAGAGTSSSAAASSSDPSSALRASAASAGVGASGSEVMRLRPSEAAGRWWRRSTSCCATPQLASQPSVFAFVCSLFLSSSQTYLYQRSQCILPSVV